MELSRQDGAILLIHKEILSLKVNPVDTPALSALSDAIPILPTGWKLIYFFAGV